MDISFVSVCILIVLCFVLGGYIGYMLGLKQGNVTAHEKYLFEQTQTASEKESELLRLQASASEAQARFEELKAHVSFLEKQLHDQALQEQARMDAQKQSDEHTLRQTARMMEAFAPIREGLTKLEHKMDAVENARQSEMGSLSAQLTTLKGQQDTLTKATFELSGVLKDNQVRGSWGEVQLKNIVESAGLLEHVEFDTQVSLTDEAGKVSKPDMIVYLPQHKCILVDAKTPFNDYERACEIPADAQDTDLARRQQLLKDHANAIRKHIDTLGSKAYWNTANTDMHFERETPDFVIAFIPNEAILRAALDVDATLLDYAFSKNIVLASPAILWAMIKSVAFSWQQAKVSDDAKEFLLIAKELYGRLSTLGDRATKLGGSITSTVKNYNNFVVALEGRQGVLASARKLNKLDPAKIIAQVGELDADTHSTKTISSSELVSEDDA